MGYHRAGFEVVGVDITPQPRYPFEFVMHDAITVSLRGFSIVHASPPCHDHTTLSYLSGKDGSGSLLGEIRKRLSRQKRLWVIENVPGAPMYPDIELCGHMFGLRTRRHRWFEFSPQMAIPSAPAHIHRPDVRTATSRRRERWELGWDVSVTGDVGVYCGPEAMGIDWMTGNELSQAIPPAYTRWIGANVFRT